MTDIYHRLAVNINEECADALRRVTAKRDISVTEAIRRAISLLDYFEKASQAVSDREQTAADDLVRLAEEMGLYE